MNDLINLKITKTKLIKIFLSKKRGKIYCTVHLKWN